MGGDEPATSDRLPWWYFVAVGALGPTLILLVDGEGPWRGVAVVSIMLIVGGLLANDRGRGRLRRRRAGPSVGRPWTFTAMILAVIVITQLVQRAGELANTWLVAAIAFVSLFATSWWFTRRVEGGLGSGDAA